MRAPFVVLVCGLALVACAPSRGIESPAAMSAAEGTTTVAMEEEAQPPPGPQARPRLSQTVTLGQGTDTIYGPYEPKQSGGGASPVVVNNTVIVQNGGYVGYPAYGYGYGYGGSRGVVPSSKSIDGRGSAPGAPSMWSTTGWEGARRTAAPGQTPGVGGNWSPPASYGPAQMR